MTEILLVLTLVSTALAIGLCAIKYMHFFQLNSYKFAEHKGWLRRNAGPLSFTAILSASLALGSVVGGTFGLIQTIIVCLIYAAVSKPKSKKLTKKPLVYTARVKRMLVTEAVISVAFISLWVMIFSRDLLIPGIGILLLFAPYLNLMANFINSPIEKAIANYYVNDAKKMLRSHPSLKVVGVTGSYGKTGTKYALTALLSEKFDVLMTPASYNTPMGVVKTIRSSLRATHEIFVCEMGAKYVGDIDELCRIVDPDIGIITSVGAQHLETFSSLDAIVGTKFELADYLSKKNCKTVVGYDNENIKNEIQNRSASDFIKCGTAGADYSISDVTADERGTSFTLTFSDGESVRLTVKLLGAHNVSNVACAAAVAHELGMTPDEIRLAARRIESAPHRLEMSRRGKDILIDDAYNANPAGTRAALDALSLFEGCKIIVTPGMIELGDESVAFNRRLGADAAKVCDYIVLVGEKQTAPIAVGALEGGFDQSKLKVFERVQDAINFAFSIQTDERRIVLIENDLPDNY